MRMTRLALATLGAALALSLVISAQSSAWQKPYLEGEAAYKKKQYDLAEQKFREAMTAPGAPKSGTNVLVISGQSGFFPEYYLALICAEVGKNQQAIDFAAIAVRYLQDDKNRLGLLQAAKTKAQNALNQGPGPDAPNPAKSLADAQAALLQDDYAEARRLAAIADKFPVNNTAVRTLLGQIDAKEQLAANRDFQAAIGEGRKALADHKYADARKAASRARTINSTGPELAQLETDITNHEKFDQLMTEADRLRDSNRPQARKNAVEAKDLVPDNSRATEFIAGLDKTDTASRNQQTFDDAMSEGNARVKARKWPDARQSAARARDTGVDAVRVADLIKQIQIGELEDKLEPLVGASDFRTAEPIAIELAKLSPAHRLVDAVSAGMAAIRAKSLDAAGREKLGIQLFYEGQYEVAFRTLAATTGDPRPRVAFYLACSKAALSLLEADKTRKDALAQEARQQFASVRAQQAMFAEDLKYLSPSIIGLLGIPR